MQQGRDIHECMIRTGVSMSGMRKRITQAMREATLGMRHAEQHLNHTSQDLMKTCDDYIKALKENRESDRYAARATNNEASAKHALSSKISQALRTHEPDDECPACDGPDI